MALASSRLLLNTGEASDLLERCVALPDLALPLVLPLPPLLSAFFVLPALGAATFFLLEADFEPAGLEAEEEEVAEVFDAAAVAAAAETGSAAGVGAGEGLAAAIMTLKAGVEVGVLLLVAAAAAGLAAADLPAFAVAFPTWGDGAGDAAAEAWSAAVKNAEKGPEGEGAALAPMAMAAARLVSAAAKF